MPSSSSRKDWGQQELGGEVHRTLFEPENALADAMARGEARGEARGREIGRQECAEEMERIRTEAEAAHAQIAAQFEEQLAEAIAAREAQLAVAARAFAEAEAALRHGRDAWLDALADNVLALSTAVAQHVVQKEIEADPALVRTLVENALRKVSVARRTVRIRVHPQCLEGVRSIQDKEVLEALEAAAAVDWIADERIEVGGCVVEADERVVDGRIDVALASLYETLAHG